MIGEIDLGIFDERPDLIGYGEGISNEEDWGV